MYYTKSAAKRTVVGAICIGLLAPSVAFAIPTEAKGPKKPGSITVRTWEDKPGNKSKQDEPFSFVAVKVKSTKGSYQKNSNLTSTGFGTEKAYAKYEDLKPGTYEIRVGAQEGYRSTSKRLKRVKVKSGKNKVVNFSFRKKPGYKPPADEDEVICC